MPHLIVTSDGWLKCGDSRYRCALGHGGVRPDKCEGDRATPTGCYPVRRLLYRADRLPRPQSRLDTGAIQPSDGWCDDPSDPSYNQAVTLPYHARAETMWRDDDLYDLVVILGHNDDPVVPHRGSAIFMHVASSDYGPTDGCVALSKPDLLEILESLDKGSEIEIIL
ncbi:MAG: L,D-transpeptidase family protein [Rhodospirillaceae bacterium]|nr:L,D-transpeptidase family protein [Rhodospirillaceae bacterium]MBT5880292.1 L,D-transpeptidase family protein [Rhodospirillaceae bacterium]